jgi:ABC-2 type transport system permease protein
MSTTTTAQRRPGLIQSDLGGARISAMGLLRSEWTKLWSVRSLWVTLSAAFTLTIALCTYMIIDGQRLGSEDGGGAIPFGWTAIYPVGMLVLVVLGVLAITNEYSTGTIHTTMVAAPRRTGVLLAKGAVITGVTTVLGVLTSVVLYVVVQAAGTIPSAIGLSLVDPEMFWGVLGGTLVLPYGALFGLVLGGLLRNAAAAIALYFVVFQMGPQLLEAFLPQSLAGVVDYMPLAAINVMRSGGLSTEPYGLGVSIIVLLGWLVVLGGATWALVKRRDV